ncbi:uncharacterized protein LOC113296311 [Papaver somniferum]|uniref:uncharacterized protein LOC113296311 n=1 Tax=Papaver somniferum TaxID=3469 RepID=UPI000E6F4931|nr:uncharacterized protein LOC113296311 [Papaver somniferum]
MVNKLARDGEDDKLAEVISEAHKTPFTKELERAPFPPKCTLPTFPSRFDGTGDAGEHINMYSMSLLQWKNYDVVMCKFSQASLEGEAKNWFYTFPDESIGNYGSLVETFLKTYMHNSIARLRVNKLFTLAQRFREPLRSLTDRWRKLCTDIGKVPVDQQIFGFENSLGKSDPIWIAMYTEKPQTLREMRKMQEHYITLEEIQEGAQDRGVQEASASVEPVPREDPKRSEKRPMAPQQGSGKKEWVEKGKKPRHEPRTYTPLNAPLEEIFKEVEKRNDIRYPKTRGIQFDETRNHPEFFH